MAVLEFKPRIVTPSRILICPQCGYENDGDHKFCGQCGFGLIPTPRTTKQWYVPKSKHTKMPLKTLEEINAFEQTLLNAPRKKTAYRNGVLFRTGISIGLRAGDLVKLKANQFLKADGSPRDALYVIEQKTNKGREIKLDSRLADMVARYVEDLKIGSNDYLFWSQDSTGHILRKSLNDNIIRPAAQRLGLDVRLYGSHTLRKTYAYQFYTQANALSRERGYRALSMLCKELGHSSEAITLCYIGIDKEEVCEICGLTADQYDWGFAEALREEFNEGE